MLWFSCYSVSPIPHTPNNNSSKWQKLIKNETAYTNKAVAYKFYYLWLYYLSFSLIGVYFATEILLNTCLLIYQDIHSS